MAGYQRQSNISNGNVIDATLFNDEYNELADAFINMMALQEKVQ